MRLHLITIAFFCCLLNLDGFALDSLRLASIEDHPFVIYRVEKGDTYFSISRQYDLEQEVIEKFNPGSLETIHIGQELKIPVAFESDFVHKVQAGETLFSLYRIYGVPVEEILELNQLESQDLAVGQEITIFKKIAYEDFEDSLEIKKVHVVSKGETLFSISRMYGMKWQDLQNLNNLPSNEISEGQVLLVSIDSGLSYVKPDIDAIPESATHEVVKGESLYSIGRKYGIQPGVLMQINGLESTEITEGQELKLADGGVSTTESSAVVAITTTPDEYLKGEKNREEVMVGNVKKIIERGMCEVIEGGEETYKYLGLHKTLPRGTIVQVKNAENDASVFVRIIGVLPDIDRNRNLVLKISPRAYDALASVNKRFRVEIYYFPEPE